MTYDGAAVFFGLMKWIGWLVCLFAVGYFVFSFGSKPFAGDVAALIFGSGISIVAIGIIGQMLAEIGTDVQIMRRISQQPKRPD